MSKTRTNQSTVQSTLVTAPISQGPLADRPAGDTSTSRTESSIPSDARTSEGSSPRFPGFRMKEFLEALHLPGLRSMNRLSDESVPLVALGPGGSYRTEYLGHDRTITAIQVAVVPKIGVTFFFFFDSCAFNNPWRRSIWLSGARWF